MIIRLVIFLALSFGALALGSLFTGSVVTSDWYNDLNKAPWMPPGWVFGFAWTTIMVCFSFYMAYLFPLVSDKKFLMTLFAIQWILNIGFNPAFFYFHKLALALILIVLLALVIGYLLVHYWPIVKFKSALILPYFVWLLIAASLNSYVLFKN